MFMSTLVVKMYLQEHTSSYRCQLKPLPSLKYVTEPPLGVTSTCGGSGGIVPPFLTSIRLRCGQLAPVALPPWERVPGTHWIGG
jgi:hypothetical protein